MATSNDMRMPPAWKATRGSKDRPIIMQKIVSKPNPQARSTVSNAIRRISSMAISPLPYWPARAPQVVSRANSQPSLVDLRSHLCAQRTSQSELEKIPHCGKRQDGGSRQPDPQRGVSRVVPHAHITLVEGSGNAGQNDGSGRKHQSSEVEE